MNYPSSMLQGNTAIEDLQRSLGTLVLGTSIATPTPPYVVHNLILLNIHTTMISSSIIDRRMPKYWCLRKKEIAAI